MVTPSFFATAQAMPATSRRPIFRLLENGRHHRACRRGHLGAATGLPPLAYRLASIG